MRKTIRWVLSFRKVHTIGRRRTCNQGEVVVSGAEPKGLTEDVERGADLLKCLWLRIRGHQCGVELRILCRGKRRGSRPGQLG